MPATVNVLVTKDVRRKNAKRWQDGVLSFSASGTSARVEGDSIRLEARVPPSMRGAVAAWIGGSGPQPDQLETLFPSALVQVDGAPTGECRVASAQRRPRLNR